MTARFFRTEVAFAMIRATNWILVNQDTKEKVLASEFTRQSYPDVCWWNIEPGRVVGCDLYKKQAGPIWIIEKPAAKTIEQIGRRLDRAFGTA